MLVYTKFVDLVIHVNKLRSLVNFHKKILKMNLPILTNLNHPNEDSWK